MSSRTIRQGQAPFGGGVPPHNFGALIFSEEWESGVGNSPVLGPGFQDLPARWRSWTPAGGGGPAGGDLRWLEVLQQRAAMISNAPTVDPGAQWIGAITPFPLDAVAFEGGPLPAFDEFAWLTSFHRCGVGTCGALYSQNASQNIHGLIVSHEDLIASPEGTFTTLGMRWQRAGADPGTDQPVLEFAQWADCNNLIGRFVQPVSQTGCLYRMDMLLQRQEPPEEPISESTSLLASYSLDDGANWLALGELALKGLPRTIGFGVSGFVDTPNAVEAMAGSGACSFIRAYQQPYNPVAQFTNPDGGRNW